VITGPDQDTAHFVFRWYAPGAIYGKVVDDRGDSVANALVQLVRDPIINGRRHASTYAWGRTDDRGNYRFGPVAPGRYYLIASGNPWYTAALRFGRQILSNGGMKEPDEPTPGYALCYYPNASDPGGASPLTVEPGRELAADFTLRTVAGANIFFRVPANGNAPAPSIYTARESTASKVSLRKATGRGWKEYLRAIMWFG